MDPVNFTGREIIEMALEIEENGMKFYSDAARAAKNEKVRSLFKTLAEEEGHHIRIFSDMKKLVGDEFTGEGFDPYIAEASQYLRSMADTEVFTNPEEGASAAVELTDEAEVLDYAIGMEKDSILFYYEFEKVILAKDRAVLEGLIEQEKIHLGKLTELKSALKS